MPDALLLAALPTESCCQIHHMTGGESAITSPVQVAAAEMGGREWQVGGHSMDGASTTPKLALAPKLATGSEQSAAPDQAAAPFTDIHGPAQQGGLWAAPRLLPVLADPASTKFGSPPRASPISHMIPSAIPRCSYRCTLILVHM